LSAGELLGLKGALIALGGATGALTRAWLSAHSGLGTGWLEGVPLGTLWANWAGSLLLGALVGALPVDGPLKAGLTTGLMGGLTTFSTLSIESASLFSSVGLSRALAHFGLHCLGGLAFAVFGLRMGLYFAK